MPGFLTPVVCGVFPETQGEQSLLRGTHQQEPHDRRTTLTEAIVLRPMRRSGTARSRQEEHEEREEQEEANIKQIRRSNEILLEPSSDKTEEFNVKGEWFFRGKGLRNPWRCRRLHPITDLLLLSRDPTTTS